ncbi:MAG TPA: DUF421 domain-containing protein [Dysgonomonas sp.]|nr:DUF421 domain-containing protein [Dysgonomonas sp.]
MNYLYTILYSAIIYIFVIIGLRLLGKKELGQLSVADLVFIMLISEVVGDVMRASDDSLGSGLLGAATLILLNKGIELWKFKSKKFNQFMEGNPVILIRHGKLNKKEMEKNKITVQDIEQMGRENGISDVSTVPLAILEVDGKVSFLNEDNLKTKIPIDGLKT